MNVGSWLLLAGFFWICGFLQLKLLEPNPDDELVFVPKWMFLLFGAPKQKGLPDTVMHARSVYLQLMGIIMALYGLLLDRHLVGDPLLSGLLGFLGSILLSGLVATYFHRKRPYLWQNESTGDE
jgi:multisubunit Na+/H+ antiporter MnhF subunit